jgi:DNA-binding IclR family transcriptional regulator
VSRVPAAEQTLAVLRHLAAQPAPVPAAAIARDLGLPRSTTYHLLAVMAGAGFVVHLPEERRYGLGVSAFELGSAYARQEPLARLARPVLARLVDRLGHNAHLAVLHGREVLYVVEERAPGRPPLVTDVGVRLPAQLTASGRAVLAALPAARHGVGPRSLTALRSLLTDVRRDGVAREDGEVTPGFASQAVAVLDHTDHPVAGLAVTWPHDDPPPSDLTARLTRAAGELSRRLGGTR